MPAPRPLDRVLRGAYAPVVLDPLVRNHDRFLRFLERRVGSRADAEDILQDAFVRGLKRAESLRDAEAVVPWFYRILRHAVADHYRRRAVEARAIQHVAAEAADVDLPPDQELLDTVCACVVDLLETLKPEYATALRRVDLDGVAVQVFAGEAGITPNNAAVRLHRARAALRTQVIECCGTCVEHGCVDCVCARESTSGRNG